MRICLLGHVLAFLCLAQTDRGNITGSVADPSNAAVPGATVVVIHTATNTTVTVKTTETGAYNVPNLQPGVYRVELSAPGFRRFVQTNITLTAGGSVAVNPRLIVGGVSETIEVSAVAAQVQTENAKSTTAVSGTLIDELPLVVSGSMRSVYNLALTTAEGRGGGETFSLGGG